MRRDHWYPFTADPELWWNSHDFLRID